MRRAGGLLLVVACAAEFMVVLDASVVNVALPAIQHGLGFDATTLTWVINAYTLVFAGCLLLGGRITDLAGHRPAFLAGLTTFVAASVVGGLAVSPAMLVVARAVQALGAAVLAPASLAVLTTTFPENRRRTRALAIWTALASAGGAAGSLLGGVLTEYLTWRSTLLVNLPLGVLAAAVALRALPADTAARRRPRLDLAGAVGATLGTGALTYALTAAPERGWTDPVTVAALAVAVVVLAGFALVEARWARSPLLPLRMLRARALGIGNIAMLLAGACLMPMWYFLSLVMAHGLGFSPLLAGLGFLPHTLITVVVGARVAPWLLERFSARTLVVAGAVVGAVGFCWQGRLTPTDDYSSGLLGPAVVLSIGGGLLNTPLTTLVTSGVDTADAGAASGLMNTTKQLGGALGLAALVAVTGPLLGGGGITVGAAHAFTVMAVMLLVVALTAVALPATDGSGA